MIGKCAFGRNSRARATTLEYGFLRGLESHVAAVVQLDQRAQLVLVSACHPKLVVVEAGKINRGRRNRDLTWLWLRDSRTACVTVANARNSVTQVMMATHTALNRAQAEQELVIACLSLAHCREVRTFGGRVGSADQPATIVCLEITR